MIEAMTVGVRVSLINQVSAVLSMIGRDFTRTEAQAAAFQTRLGKLQSGMLRGGLWIGAGAAGLMLFKKPLEAAAELQTKMVQIGALGFGGHVLQDSLKFAQGMDIYGMSLIDKMGVMKDALSVFNDLDKAKIVAPVLAKMIVANQKIYGADKAQELSLQALPLLKVAELRGGLVSQAMLLSQMQGAEQSFIASGGLVNATQYLAAMKSGAIPLKLMSNKALYQESEPILQEMGGFRFGTGMNAIYNNLVQGRSATRAVMEMMRLGLLDSKKVEFTSIGTVKRMRPGALHGTELLKSDYVAWMRQILLPSLAAHGITGQSAVLDAIGSIIGNSRGAQIMSTAYMQLPAIDRAVARVGHAANIDQIYKTLPTTLQGAEGNLGARWKDLMTTIGTNLLPVGIGALNSFANGLKSLNGVLLAHPGAVKALAGGLAALSAAALGRGVWILASSVLQFTGVSQALGFGLRALIPVFAGLSLPITLVVAGITAVVFALYEMWKHWDTTKGVIWNIRNEFTMLFDWLQLKIHTLLPWLVPAPQQQFHGGGGAFAKPAIHVTVNTHVDGRMVARSVSKHQGNSSNAPNTGPSHPDTRLAPLQAGGYTGSW